AAELFSDDFEDGNSTGWSKSGGSWSVVNDGTQVFKQSSTSSNAYAYTGNSVWTNYTVEAKVKALSFNGTARSFGITARYTSTSNYYYLSLGNDNQIILGKKASSGSKVLASKTFTVSTGSWYTLKLVINGNQFEGYVNDNLQLTATDSTLTSGKAGLMALYTSAEFDGFLVDGAIVSSPTPSSSGSPPPSDEVKPSPTIISPSPTVSLGPSPSPYNTTNPIGFASVNALGQDGTTGGAGGPTVTVTTTEQFLDYISRPEPYIIRVAGTITLPRGDTDGMHSVASDKTIIGVGSNAALVGGGVLIGLPVDDAVTSMPANAVHNIIIRNLSFSGASDDAINVQMFSHHIWIDHCDFSNGGDGLVDIKRGSDFITVSWNRFHDHYKTCLLGHDDANGAQDSGRLRVTYHHNFFDRSDQRNPRVRFSA
ncbi:MAG TPA: family 16 glycoside hydrolase, partial [Bacillota bacterium]|nr:family 16 glycoside hydrolase [Bacillota bacterium]